MLAQALIHRFSQF